jgi:hypothetical protein
MKRVSLGQECRGDFYLCETEGQVKHIPLEDLIRRCISVRISMYILGKIEVLWRPSW